MKKQKHLYINYIVLTLVVLLLPAILEAHANDAQLAKLSRSEVFTTYLQLGFTHIIPLGFDHILFIISLFLLSPKLKTIVTQATVFTIAHTITLGLAIYIKFDAPAHLIEPIIALSIFFVAIENVITDKLKSTRLIVVFAFGLIHGLGFAGVLSDLGLPKKEFFNALISFNVGVELGQLAIILLAWFLFAKWFNQKSWYRNRIVIPISLAIAAVALYWTIERVFFL